MKFLKLDKKKGSGGPSIKSRYAYLIYLDDIDYLPSTDDKGVRMEGDIVLKEDCKMMPLYLTSSSQEFSYDILGDDDEKSYLVKFSGTHPGTELEALEFAKNMIEQPFLVLIPSCNETEPWKLLGELTNPLIFTSSHKSGKEGSKFTFNFEQRIGSEFIYFSYGGVEVPSGGEGVDPPGGGFDPTKWAKRNAENITDENVILWREALRIYEEDKVLTLGTITATTTTLTLALHTSGVNSVLLSGVERSKTEGDDFTFAPVSAGKLKYVLLYALPDPQLFHIIEGVEGSEAIYPDLPPGALLIKAVLISEFGALLEDADGGYKPLAEDPWRNILINSNAAVNIIMASSPSASFNVLLGAGVTDPKIAAIKTKVKKNTRDGQEITFYNDSDVPVALLAGDYEETLVYTTFPFADNYEIKPRSFAKFKRKENKYHELSGGSASFPETGSNADVLVKDSAVDGGVKWSNRLTTAETAITTEKNRNDTQDGLISDLSINQIEITTTTSITTNTAGTGADAGKGQHMRSVLVKNGVNAITITLETTSHAKFEAIYYKKGSAAITFLAGAGATLVKVANDGILNGAVDSNALVYRDGDTFHLYISNY